MENIFEQLRAAKSHSMIHIRRALREINLTHKISKLTQDPIKLSFDGKQTFFGYYDKTPFSLDNNKVLALIAPYENNPPHPTDNLIVGYFDSSNNYSFHQVGKTNTWCWQQGCRLQWFPKNENQLIVYNKLVNGEYGSVIQNIETGETMHQYEFPLYDVDKKGLWAISLNFSRLHRLRPGYGYVNIPDATISEPCPENDGVWQMNLSTGEIRLLVSLKDLERIQPHKSMEGAIHYVNHLLFNPSGDRFMFLHLWVKGGKRFSRLFTCDADGRNLYLLANEGLVSHHTWKSDSELLVYSYHKDSGRCYHMYKDMTDKRGIFGLDMLTEDGHPSFNPNGNVLLTDTYPDKYSERKILILDSKENLHVVGSFYSPLNFKGEVRCDLHPRWDRAGQSICFDSAHGGYRSLYLIDVNSLLKN